MTMGPPQPDPVASTSSTTIHLPNRVTQTPHPWDESTLSLEATQHEGKFHSYTRRRVKVNVAGFPPDYPYRLQGSQNVRTFCYGMLPFLEFRGAGVPSEDFGITGDVYIDTTPGAEALYYCTLVKGSARGPWARWDGTYPPPKHPYLCDESRYPRYLWVQPKSTTWASNMTLAGLSQEILHPYKFSRPNGAETQRQALVTDIVGMLAQDPAGEQKKRRGRPPRYNVKLEPGEGDGAVTAPVKARKRKRESETPLSAPPPRRMAAKAAAKALLESANAQAQLSDEEVARPIQMQPPPLAAIMQLPKKGPKQRPAQQLAARHTASVVHTTYGQPLHEATMVQPPGSGLKQRPAQQPAVDPTASISAPAPAAPARIPLPRRKNITSNLMLNGMLSQLHNIREHIAQGPQEYPTTQMDTDLQNVVDKVEESRLRMDMREKEITDALRTKDSTLYDMRAERTKLVGVVQTLQKEFAKIFLPAWRASVNPAQLSNPRFNYENNIAKVMTPAGPTELDKAKDRIAQLEKELEGMRMQDRARHPPPLLPIKLEPQAGTPLHFFNQPSGATSAADSDVEALDDLVLEYPED